MRRHADVKRPALGDVAVSPASRKSCTGLMVHRMHPAWADGFAERDDRDIVPDVEREPPPRSANQLPALIHHPCPRSYQRRRHHHHRANQPDSMPAVVRIVWPTAPTLTTPSRYFQIASTAMRLPTDASTTLAMIKASRRL